MFAYSNPTTGGKIRSSRRNPCPICQSTDAKCLTYEGQGTLCHNQPNEQGRLSNASVPSWWHAAADQGQARPAVTLADLDSTPRPLSPITIDKVNRRLLELCPLSTEHAKYLANEGVPTTSCGTFHRSDTSRIARALVAEFGESVARLHPALIQFNGKAGSKYWAVSAYGDGLLLPATNTAGLVLGVQIRHDHPKGDKDRYKWLGHDGLAGTPLSVFVHHGGQLLVITEGYKKAAIASQQWDCHAISLAGVSSYKESELLATLEALKVTRVAVAFDQDKRQKVAVAKAESHLFELLAASRPELKLYALEWDGDQGKGLDNALKNGAEFRFNPVLPKRAKVITDLPLEAHASAFGGPARPMFTLEQARAKHSELFEKVLTQNGTIRAGVTSVTGTGKSTAADNAVARLVLSGKLNKRVLILAPDQANLKERTAPSTLLGKAVLSGAVAIQLGRQSVDLDDPEHKVSDFDCANQEAKQAGAARHIPAKVVCSGCPFGSAKLWEEKFPGQPRLWECEEEGYLASRKRSKAAQVVIATKETYLNGSKELEEFEIVIVDESLLDKLLETVNLGKPEIATWRQRVADKGMEVDPEVINFFALLETTLDQLADKYPAAKAGANEDEPATLYPVIEMLKEVAAQIDVTLESYGFGLPGVSLGANDVYEFERFYYKEDKLKIPYRAAVDFLDALPAGELRLNARRLPSGRFTFEIKKLRAHLVEMLNRKTLIVLDATLPPALRALFPDIEEVHFDVPQALEIWQTTNSLYTSRGLYNEKTRATVEATAAHFFEGTERPLSYVPLRFEQEFNLPGEVSHWGCHRATNQYSNCDAMLLIGHHLRPISDIKAEVDCLRAYGYLEAAADQGDQSTRLRLYNFVNQDGHAAGRWCKSDPDQALQEAIEADYTANVIQAIGRLRAALRPAGSPVRVLIMCAEPVGDLKIDQLLTVKELMKAEIVSVDRPQIEEVEIHTPLKSGFLQINSFGTEGKAGGMVPEPSTIVDTAPPRSFYFGLLDRQEWPEGIADVVRRIKDNGLLGDVERKKLLEYALERRKLLEAG